MPVELADEAPAFRMVRPIGRGGMGEVFLAIREEGEFRRSYAVKRLRGEILSDDVAVRAFVDEARLMGLLRHPNVVRVFDVGRDQDGPFMLMEYIDGLSLKQLIRGAIRLEEVIPPCVVLELMRDVALGLDSAHEARDLQGQPLEILHRDISPDNILVGRDGIARLTDFGIAKAFGRLSETTRDLLKGKVSYMAPERLRFGEGSVEADMWSFGVVLYEALTHMRLYGGADGPRRALDEAPPDIREVVSEAPDKLVQLIFALLAKSPASRPKRARDVAQSLDECIAELSVEDDAGMVSLAKDFVAPRIPITHQ